MQTATTHATSTSTTSADPALASSETTAQSDGFALDEFLDGTCEQEPADERGRFRVVIDNLGAGFVRTVALMIDAAAPAGASSAMELAAMVRCPIEPPLFITGTLGIKAARSSGTVTASLAGGLGLSIGDGMGAFADLMANTSVQGEGGDSTRAVEMLVLAIETYIRSAADPVLMSLSSQLPFGIMLAPLVMLSTATGYGLADLIADAVWGIGHAGAVKASMKDGEAAQISAGASLGGSASAPGDGGPDAGGEIKGSITGTTRIEKTAGKDATTTHSADFGIATKVTIGPVSGGVEIQVPVKKPNSGKATFSGSFTGNPAQLGSLQKFVAFFTGALTAVQEAFAAPPPEAAAAAKETSSALSQLQQAVGPAIIGAQDLIVQELASSGLVGAQATIEASLELDLATKAATLKFAVVTKAKAELPGGNSGSVARKLPVGSPIVFPIG